MRIQSNVYFPKLYAPYWCLILFANLNNWVTQKLCDVSEIVSTTTIILPSHYSMILQIHFDMKNYVGPYEKSVEAEKYSYRGFVTILCRIFWLIFSFFVTSKILVVSWVSCSRCVCVSVHEIHDQQQTTVGWELDCKL